MCFTIEPGLYNKEHFGVRLENSCYLENGEIKSFTNMCYEKKLIDFSMLNEQEKEWLMGLGGCWGCGWGWFFLWLPVANQCKLEYRNLSGGRICSIEF